MSTIVKSCLNEVRKSKGITLLQLEKMCGVSKSELNNIENMRVSPRLDTLALIASALQCKISDLYSE